MSLITASTVAKIMVDKLKRSCPSCKRTQLVPRDKLRDTVKCRFCGKEIPPKK